jgi:hypothetical protein
VLKNNRHFLLLTIAVIPSLILSFLTLLQINYMQTFGYLDNPKDDAPEGLIAESLYAENAIVEGIKNVQRFGGLHPSGVIDEATIQLMNSPRCGVKDITSEKERRKRYIVGSKNWKKKKITY